MDDTEICRLCGDACGIDALTREQSLFDWNPLTDAEQAAAVRWKLLELGYTFKQRTGQLIVCFPFTSLHGTTSLYDCLTISDEYRILAETLARHQEGTKNG